MQIIISEFEITEMIKREVEQKFNGEVEVSNVRYELARDFEDCHFDGCRMDIKRKDGTR